MSERTDLLTLYSDPNLQLSENQIESHPKSKVKVKLIEKTHQNQKKEHNFEVAPKKEEKNERKDVNGTIINHHNRKKVKVTFRDRLNKSIGLCDIIEVESIKAFNYIPSTNGYNDIYQKKQKRCCCIIY